MASGVYTQRTVSFGVGGYFREKARSAASALTANTEVLVWREVGAPPKREPTLEAPAAPAGIGAIEGAARGL